MTVYTLRDVVGRPNSSAPEFSADPAVSAVECIF